MTISSSSGGTGTSDFSITSSSPAQPVIAGNNTLLIETVAVFGSFNGAVTFSVTGLPAGVTPSFSPPTVIGAGSATLAIYTDTSTAAGSYPLIIRGTSGNLTRTAAVTLVVSASNLPVPQLTSIAPASARAGQVTTVTITGQNTHLVQCSSQANFGAGITVGSSSSTADGLFGPITVTSATTATATIAINRAAALGARSIAVQNGPERATADSAFTVTEALPVVTIFSPTNLSFTNISVATVRGTVSPNTAGVTVNGITAPVSSGSSGCSSSCRRKQHSERRRHHREPVG